MWRDILKNIQISGQRALSADLANPENENDEESCYEFFYKLVKILDPSFELPYIVYNDESKQPADYWCWLMDEPRNYNEMMAFYNTYLLKTLRTSPINGIHVSFAYEQRRRDVEYDGRPKTFTISIGSKHFFLHKYREGRLLAKNERMTSQDKMEEIEKEIKRYLGV